MYESRVRLEGSTRTGVPGATQIGKTDGSTVITITVTFKRKTSIDDALRAHVSKAPHLRQERNMKDVEAAYGADPDAIARFVSFARSHDLKVVSKDAGQRVVVLSGTVTSMEKAFGTVLHDFVKEKTRFRGRQGPVFLPKEIVDDIVAVQGLDDRPVAAPRIGPRQKGVTMMSPADIATIYGIPAGTGTGQRIALIELGGNYDTAELQTYFAGIKVPMPAIRPIGTPEAWGASEADGEVMLDIEVAGAVAPGASIDVYFAPNNDDGFISAFRKAIHAAGTTIVSISWGSAESGWTAQSLNAWTAAAEDAAAADISVFVAAGDHGASDQVPNTPNQPFDGQRHADFPGTLPHVFSCGGTHLETSGGKILSETVWNSNDGWASGGGVSIHFAAPTWQSGLSAEPPTLLARRGVPDVAAVADNTGTVFKMLAHGQTEPGAGTSAVAPFWAGITARLNEKLNRRAGFYLPTLYGSPNAGACRDIVVGDNAAFGVPGYSAHKGWDACSGLGSPNGAALFALLGAGTAAAPGKARLARAKRTASSKKAQPRAKRTSRNKQKKS
jgi:kumamolisin